MRDKSSEIEEEGQRERMERKPRAGPSKIERERETEGTRISE